MMFIYQVHQHRQPHSRPPLRKVLVAVVYLPCHPKGDEKLMYIVVYHKEFRGLFSEK